MFFVVKAIKFVCIKSFSKCLLCGFHDNLNGMTWMVLTWCHRKIRSAYKTCKRVMCCCTEDNEVNEINFNYAVHLHISGKTIHRKYEGYKYKDIQF